MSFSLFSAKQLNHLKKVCAGKPQVLAVFLFGSHLDGYTTPFSDVDLAILWEGPLPLSEQLSLEVSLCRALEHEDLDIVWLKEAPLGLQFRAISGRLLYERTPDAVSDFIQRKMVEYYDFQHVLKTYEREFTKSLEQDYGL